MKTFSFFLFSFFLLCCSGFGQSQMLFEGTEGDALSDSVITNYKTINVLDYDEARDFLYGEVYNDNDTVTCIYTGHSIYLPPNVDPSTHLWMGGSSFGINAEHAYPQSKGAGASDGNGNARSDMHHIFPVRAGVNSARGNKFFGEVDDNLADRWYRMDEQQGDIPTNNIDEWSERSSQVFEPREESKGNIARAIMYFYMMYKEQADLKDDFFFDVMRVDLCQWHSRDPVDLDELIRTYIIATFQDDKANPFVLDCSLAGRTFCGDILTSCEEITSTSSSCDNAVETIIVTNEQVVGTYVANTISTQGTVEVLQQATFKASETIQLTSGFHAQAGSSFLAVIEDCSGSSLESTPDELEMIEERQSVIPATDNIQEQPFSIKVYPNPFKESTMLTYELPDKAFIKITIYDVLGRPIQLVQNGLQESGVYQLPLVFDDWSQGIYFLGMQYEEDYFMKQLVIK